MNDTSRDLAIGFIPLIDCAPLAIAQELGLFAAEGLNVMLSREKSWANIRDKLFVGSLQCAHMLAPMTISVTLGLNRVTVPLVTSFAMNLNGNSITISNSLRDQLRTLDPESLNSAHQSVLTLKMLVDQRKESGQAPLTFAMVYPYSCHNYLLRYWLAAGGINPDSDINLVVIPPQQMTGQLAAGRIDGLCVGEPWNQVAVDDGFGYNLLNCHQIWHNAPEKVLAAREDWATDNPDTYRRLLRSLLQAAAWLAEPDNHHETVALLAQPQYLNLPRETIDSGLKNGRHVFNRFHANFPWRSHALWLLSQMVRWGQLHKGLDMCELAGRIYQPELYRQACIDLGLGYPTQDYKLEGRHASEWIHAGLTYGSDRFIDGLNFDPGQLIRYVENFDIINAVIPVRDFSCGMDTSAAFRNPEAILQG